MSGQKTTHAIAVDQSGEKKYSERSPGSLSEEEGGKNRQEDSTLLASICRGTVTADPHNTNTIVKTETCRDSESSFTADALMKSSLTSLRTKRHFFYLSMSLIFSKSPFPIMMDFSFLVDTIQIISALSAVCSATDRLLSHQDPGIYAVTKLEYVY